MFDRPYRFVVNYSYDFPRFLRGGGGKFFPVLRALLSHWRLGGFSEWQSGQPFTIQTGVDSGGSGVTAGWRPDYNPAGTIRKDPVEGNFRTFQTPFNEQGVFLTPLTPGGLPLGNSMPRGGNLGRNTFRGPSFSNWNISLTKMVPIAETVNVELRADWFNAWNHRNFGNPVAVMGNPAFGANTTDPGGRTMLLGLKIRY